MYKINQKAAYKGIIPARGLKLFYGMFFSAMRARAYKGIIPARGLKLVALAKQITSKTYGPYKGIIPARGLKPSTSKCYLITPYLRL